MFQAQRAGSQLRIVLALTAISMLTWFVVPTFSKSTTLVKVDGSSTVFPITEAVAEEFQRETRGAVRVTVGI